MRPTLAPLLLAGVLALASTTTLASPDPALAELRQLMVENRINDAVKAGEQAVEAFPDDARLWVWLGRAYGRRALEANLLSRAGWAGKTRDAWEKAVALDPNNMDARFDLMQYYLQAPGMLGGGVDKAKAQAEAVALLNPAYGQIARGVVAMSEKDKAAAEAAWRDAIKLAPTDPRARNAWSGFLSREQRWEELLAFWNEQAAAYPDDAMVQFQLGRASAVSGQKLEEGLAALDRFESMENRPHEDLLAKGAPEWRRGNLLEKLGRTDDALAAYQAAVAANPNLPDAKKDLERLSAAR